MASNNGVFPELTIELGPSTTRSANTTTTSPLGQTVENALREVLAWRPRSSDAKGFVAALNQAFKGNEVDGHMEFVWQPRSYAVQADMGEVTGAQASIHARARHALEHTVPLLEGLTPLRADADEEDSEAARSLVISQLTELVNELGQPGGPRLDRVDGLFSMLLGDNNNNKKDDPNNKNDDPEAVEGLFGLLRDRFGLQRDHVNNVAEEQNLTNLLIGIDHTLSLRRSLEAVRHYFNREGSDVFLGTQLVLFSRAFNTVADSVQELYFVFDSLFLGAAERQTVKLRLGNRLITIDELFSWVERFVTEEAPQIIRDAGKDGVIAFRPTVVKLKELVDAAVALSGKPNNGAQAGFHHPRAHTALLEVATHMNEVLTLTSQIQRQPAPKVFFVNTNPVPALNGRRLTISGKGFQRGATVYLNEWGPNRHAKIFGTAVAVVDETVLHATFDLTGRDNTAWAVVVKNPDGQSGSAVDALLVEAVALPTLTPTIRKIDPDQSLPNVTVEVRIEGANFSDPIQCDFGAGISATAIVADPTLIKATLTIDKAARRGPRDVVLTDARGNDAIKLDGFTVLAPPAPPPTITRIAPDKGAPGTETPIFITGTGFQPGATLTLKNTTSDDVTVSFGPGWFASTSLMAVLQIADDADDAVYDVIITNHDGKTATLPDSFTVESEHGTERNPPTISDFHPGETRNAEPDETLLIVHGANFAIDAELRLEMVVATRQITLSPNASKVINAGKIEATFALHDQQPGKWQVVVISNGERVEASSPFVLHGERHG